MANVGQLQAVATAMDLERWWYPVWGVMLQVYVGLGYVTPQLAVAFEPALEAAGGGPPYAVPDFGVFETPIGGVVGNKTLHMVMECKRRATAGQLIQAQLDLVGYMGQATNGANDVPNVNLQTLWGIATAGGIWTSWQMVFAGGAWGPVVWHGILNNTATALNVRVPI